MFESLKYLKQAFTNQEVIYSLDKKKMVKALKYLKQVFDKYDIPFWFCGGTFLGAVRDGKIIPWDDDIDINMYLKDFGKLLEAKKEFDDTEFEFYIISLHIPTYGFGHYGIRDRKTKKHLICIFFNYEAKGYLIKARFLPIPGNAVRYFDMIKCDWLLRISWKMMLKFHFYKDEKVRYPMEYFGNSTTIKFYDEEFRIPEKYDECLTYVFGDWRTPKKNDRGYKRMLKDIKEES